MDSNYTALEQTDNTLQDNIKKFRTEYINRIIKTIEEKMLDLSIKGIPKLIIIIKLPKYYNSRGYLPNVWFNYDVLYLNVEDCQEYFFNDDEYRRKLVDFFKSKKIAYRHYNLESAQVHGNHIIGKIFYCELDNEKNYDKKCIIM